MLAPFDFYLFGNMKDNLGGFRFRDLDGVKKALKSWVKKQSFSKMSLMPWLTDGANVCKYMVTMLNSSFV